MSTIEEARSALVEIEQELCSRLVGWEAAFDLRVESVDFVRAQTMTSPSVIVGVRVTATLDRGPWTGTGAR